MCHLVPTDCVLSVVCSDVFFAYCEQNFIWSFLHKTELRIKILTDDIFLRGMNTFLGEETVRLFFASFWKRIYSKRKEEQKVVYQKGLDIQ